MSTIKPAQAAIRARVGLGRRQRQGFSRQMGERVRSIGGQHLSVHSLNCVGSSRQMWGGGRRAAVGSNPESSAP